MGVPAGTCAPGGITELVGGLRSLWAAQIERAVLKCAGEERECAGGVRNAALAS